MRRTRRRFQGVEVVYSVSREDISVAHSHPALITTAAMPARKWPTSFPQLFVVSTHSLLRLGWMTDALATNVETLFYLEAAVAQPGHRGEAAWAPDFG